MSTTTAPALEIVPKRLSAAEVLVLFEQNSGSHATYQKFSKIIARRADVSETVFTIVDGKLETIKAAGFDDWVVMNAMLGGSAERYILEDVKFRSRYRLLSDDNVLVDGHNWVWAQAVGTVTAFLYQGEPIQFEAPWGEDMTLEAGDMLCRPPGGPASDIYRIERKAFGLTYRPVQDRF